MILFFRYKGILFAAMVLYFFFRIQAVSCQFVNDPYSVDKIPLAGVLSGLSGRCIIQDSHGFMWFGTNHGLFRYDGMNYKQFRHNPDDSTSISNDRILGIVSDMNGDLWIATGGGLNKYLAATGKIIRFNKNPLVPEIIANGSLQSIYHGFSSCLWIETDTALIKYTPKTNVYQSFSLNTPEWQDPQMCRNFFGMVMGMRWGLWVKYGDRQLCKFNVSTGKADTVVTGPSSINDLFIDMRGRFWVASKKGLYQFNPNLYIFTRVLDQPDDPNKLHNQTVLAIQEDRSGNLWIRTLDGLYVYNADMEILFRANHDEVNQYSYEDIHLSSQIYGERSGTIWYFTRDAICKCYPKQHQFNTVTDFEPQHINSLCEGSNRNILFGSESLYLYDRKNNTSRKLSFQIPGSDSDKLGIESMLFNKQNKILWLGSNNGELYKFNFQSDSIKDIRRYGQLDYEQPGVNNSPFMNLFEDKKGKIWIHVRDKLPILFDPAQERVWNLYSGLPGQEYLEADSRILHEYNNGALLVLGKKGLYRFHPPFTMLSATYIAPDSISSLLNIEIDGKPLLGKIIASSYMDTEDRLWLGTISWGLLRVDGAGNLRNDSSSVHLRRYTTSHGLPNNSIHNLVEDHHDNLWIGTDFGLSRMNPVSEVFTSYNMLHGLPTCGFRGEGALRCIDGMLFFSTRSGLLYFNPDNSRGNQEVPRVYITGLKIHNREVFPGENQSIDQSIFLTDTLILEPHQNHLSFEFAALNYIMPHNNQYKYMLEGVDKDWVYCGNRNYTNYSDLKPGKYTFRITASNNDGLWNPVGTSLYFVIPRPWYQSAVALIIWSVMLILAISGYIRFRTRKLWRDKMRLEMEVETRINEIRWMNEQIIEMEALKTRFFNNISHEFRNLISLIKVPVECLKEEVKLSKKCSMKLDAIRRNTNKMASLVNQLLDIAKIDKGSLKLKLSESNICDFVHAIAVSYSSLAETKGIHYKYILSRNDCVEMFDEDKLEKIINNLLSNAFKFTGEGGKVILGLKRKSKENGFEEALEITVSDTGSGIRQEEQKKIFDRFYQAESTLFNDEGGAGIGLALTYDLVELMHGTIRLESEYGEGSTFTVQIPLGRKHLNENEYSVIKRENPDDFLLDSDDKYPGADPHQISNPCTKRMDSDDIPLILIVEDNAEIRTMLAQHLAHDFHVAEAINGSAGLKIATEQMPDLVLTDLMMPGMDGVELCSRLKSNLRTSHIPVIMLTGKASMEDRIQGLESGADDYIAKPFEIKEIETRIKNLVEQRQKLKEKFSHIIPLDSQDVIPSSLDEKFLQNVIELVEQKMSNEAFNVSGMCKELHISRSTLSRKLNALTGMSPVEFIRACRLQRAAILLKQQFGNVSQVALEVGFSNPSYFTRMFRQSYEISPSKYARSDHRPQQSK